MKKTMRLFSTLTLVLVLATAFVGCKENKGNDDKIRIASVGPLSGDVVIYGSSTKEGIELAIEEINAAGGVKVGDEYKEIEWLGMIDDAADPVKSGEAFNTQYAKDIDLMLGAVTSGATNGLIGQAIGKEVLVITPTGTADYLTVGANGDERDLRGNVFRACFNDSYQGEIAAKFINKNLQKTKVAVLYNAEDSYSKGLYAAFKAVAAQNNIEVVKEVEYQNNTSDFNSAWANVKASGAEVVYIPEYYEKVVTIVSQGRDAGYNGAIVGGDGWDGVLNVAGVDTADFTNCYFTNHFAADSTEETVSSFVTKFKTKYGKAPTSFAALGYDAVYLYKAAVEKAGTTDFAKVLAVFNDANFAVNCVTGNIKFNANGNAVKPAVVMTFDGAAYKYYATVE